MHEFEPLDRILPNGMLIEAGVIGLATKDNKSIVHAFYNGCYEPICNSYSYSGYYDIPLIWAPKITCQKCLAIMYNKKKKLMSSVSTNGKRY